jgi:hypothetical protein
MGEIPDRVEPLLRCGRGEINHIGAQVARELKPFGWRPDRHHRRRPLKSGERNRAQADGAGALHEHGLASAERGTFQDMDRSQQTASAADVVVYTHRRRQARDADARLEINELRPAPEQSIVG